MVSTVCLPENVPYIFISTHEKKNTKCGAIKAFVHALRDCVKFSSGRASACVWFCGSRLKMEQSAL